MKEAVNIKIKLLNQNAKIPIKATEHASGFDLFSAEEAIIKPKEFKAISTGIAIEMPQYIEAQIRPRSGLAMKYGITVLNAPGTIDSDYRGEIKVILINHSNNEFKIEVGTRIAQMVFTEIIKSNFQQVESLNESDRGDGGFGSTGLQ
ncbi:MAG TPA: dUTP diphosphatase [Spirochaetota bacterium]|nr:dUTP diphosphatase [Spirochaetota bacterium]HOL56111.1 dUTP diphosphatase [Spirochaetota bacterium]HPP04817.1 dUTP diphosphatase [Spirochaetota bacterium]